MKTITIESQHGYLRDSNGDVIVRFGNWETGNHSVLDAVASVDYVDSPNAHTETVADKYDSRP